ncbi:MAG: hypothetical protein ACTSWW_01070 [Promethearchaeota archaeon]
MSPHRTPRIAKRSPNKKQGKRQWMGFWIMLAITVSTLIAVALIMNTG